MHNLNIPPVMRGRDFARQIFSGSLSGSRDGSSGWSQRNKTRNAQLVGAVILLVEDEATVAADIGYEIISHGAELIGPAGTLKEALDLIDQQQQISAAVLDVRLRDETVYPAADLLVERGVPLLFHTGHARRDEVRHQFPNARICLKPQRLSELINELAQLVAT